jgi:hypothetical protein
LTQFAICFIAKFSPWRDLLSGHEDDLWAGFLSSRFMVWVALSTAIVLSLLSLLEICTVQGSRHGWNEIQRGNYRGYGIGGTPSVVVVNEKTKKKVVLVGEKQINRNDVLEATLKVMK